VDDQNEQRPSRELRKCARCGLETTSYIKVLIPHREDIKTRQWSNEPLCPDCHREIFVLDEHSDDEETRDQI